MLTTVDKFSSVLHNYLATWKATIDIPCPFQIFTYASNGVIFFLYKFCTLGLASFAADKQNKHNLLEALGFLPMHIGILIPLF